MGFSGLARWPEAPATTLDTIMENIVRNHSGQSLGRWGLQILSYRSTLAQSDDPQFAYMERSLITVTMNNRVYALLDDPGAPEHRDIDPNANNPPPTHFRQTYMTLSPPGALEHLFQTVKARWAPVRSSQRKEDRSQNLTIEGYAFAVGTDWIIRVGSVGKPELGKGIIIEAEYLPVPFIYSPKADGSSDFVTDFIATIVPNDPNSKINIVSIHQEQWEEVLWNRQEAEKRAKETEKEKPYDPEDIYVYGDEEIVKPQKSDWTGIERDKRVSFLIIAMLRQEGILVT